MKTAIITIFLFFVHLTLFAQQKEAVFRVGGGYVFAGTDFIHTASLDRSLRQYHLPEFGGARNATTFGAGGGVFINRFFYGGEGAGQVGLSASNDYYHSKIYGGRGSIHVGYALIQNSTFAFYPTFGAGGGGTAMRLDEGASFSGDRDGLLLDPDTKLHTAYMLLKLGLNGDFFFGSNKNKTGGMMLGIAAGYQLAPLVSRWEYDDHSVPELDKYDPSGFYLRLKVGWAKGRP